jgi:hypothetical protein
MVTRKAIQVSARKLIGAEWQHQGRNPNAGIDCIGGIIFIGLDTGYFTDKQIQEIDVLDYSRQPTSFELLLQKLAEQFDVIPIYEACEGDILTFRMAGERLTSHVATITKGDREYMIVHSLENKVTIEEPLRRWHKFITGAFRFRNVTD